MVATVQWQTAAPLWAEALKDKASPARLQQPAVLRFADDSFMDDLAGTLETDYTKISGYSVRDEDWRNPNTGWLPENDFQQTGAVKLYQPAHGRFYLVAASLVCQLPGLPEKAVLTNRGERIFFVLRRLTPKKGQPTGLAATPFNLHLFDELGWFPGRGWLAMAAPEAFADGEERLPMFGMSYCHTSQIRRILLGLIPVSSRETFQAATPDLDLFTDPATGKPAIDPRLAELQSTVMEGLYSLQNALTMTSGEQAEEVLLMIALDFADYIQQYLKDDPSQVAVLVRTFTVQGLNTTTWRQAVEYARTNRAAIRAGTLKDFSYWSSLNDADTNNAVKTAINNLGMFNVINGQLKMTDAFADAMTGDLNKVPPAPPPGGPVEIPKFDPNSGSFYIARCVYERPECVVPLSAQLSPNSALPATARLLHPPLISKPSLPFRMAPFFDPDAPARPIRIALPVDTSPQGLRKFPHNVSMLISDQLRSQMERVKNISDLEQGNLGSSSIDFGMICTLSIPIITICALILLMIIVSLLNIIFWWLPFFKICIPAPMIKK